ncbi:MULTISPECIES: cytochrome c oxidase subunit IVB [Heyndrickxia]|jgi:cytochrome c oxidase subunit 4|uniref:Cytochrome c oxidase subunit IVB n=1 Tax=Heyndrickxia oleronia TaxID=38875 RepID=A0A8E2IC44_9BACI|nr:cytochrome c oxidase subunit IVB [Heyndrickxia oleronia]NYV67498.1 cytochrome c oxidase subunit IVB [Bacillus sp. Gen3]OJH17924.1 cytochrome c oxidase subunit IVB [Bacillus obstructivus]MBU5210931.1 cytochrome c oxidase subunit IVB [Heyndrickxia oleronia]MCI1589754.1 cytochrome c oxidase subunit IVB [Heyndrickxia oleronia]MCI1611499.1 cytochrome c oxidase subunit IVB [Heyndrickxia oleronia]
MTNEQLNSGNPRVDYEYRRRKNAEEMKYQVISFILMILLTLIAFGAVAADLSKWFIIPFILLLAVVQVIFQLYYFMHMSHKGHEAPQLFMYSGALVGFLTLLTFFTIIWW